ncbi:hypothetical protein BOG92_049970 [Streptomyces sp. WAC00263]|nr:hypothetical protein BOG92_049970 [Streptomyces sp. WAC00263]
MRSAQGRCPACGASVSVRKQTETVYCSPKCRTRAWRKHGLSRR